jgi:hypothetical protein
MRKYITIVVSVAIIGCAKQLKQTAFHGTIEPGFKTNELVLKCQKRDGANFLGVYMGMIAELDGVTKHYDAKNNRMYGSFPQGVMMFSAASGECLKWISFDDFKAIFVDKTKPEYPIH